MSKETGMQDRAKLATLSEDEDVMALTQGSISRSVNEALRLQHEGALQQHGITPSSSAATFTRAEAEPVIVL